MSDHDRLHHRFRTDADWYVQWTQARQALMLGRYPAEWWKGKTVLELGAGLSNLCVPFVECGAIWTVSDAVPMYVKKMHDEFNVQGTLADLDQGWSPYFEDRYDVIINLGLLYHLRDPEDITRECARRCSFLVLETECCDVEVEMLMTNVQEPHGFDQAWNKVGCRPSPSLIEKYLREEGMDFEVIKDLGDVGRHNYNWEVKNTREWGPLFRRWWFCERSLNATA